MAERSFPHRPLPVSVKWTLRFTLAMMVIVSAMAFYHYELVARRLREDALLLLQLQASEIAESVERHAGQDDSQEELHAYVDQHVTSADPELKLGIRVLDRRGGLLLERGIFEQRDFPVPDRLDELAGAEELLRVDVGDGYPYDVVVSRIPGGFVEVAMYERRFLRNLHELRDAFLLSLPVALVLTGLLGWILARGSLSPIARMSEAARRISASQLDESVPVSGSGDDLDTLAGTLNEMLGRIRAGVERLRAFSSVAAHQLRTPISRLRSRLEFAAVQRRDAGRDAALIEASLHDVERVAAAIGGLLRLAESESGLPPERRKPVALRELLRDVVEFFEPLASERGIALTLDAPQAGTVSGDAEWLHELFANLVDNALKFTPAGGSVRVELDCRGDAAAVKVRDTGPGIPPDEMARVFERFYRGKGDGLGLGLCLAEEIADAHGGRIELESAPGRGALFTVRLPLRGAD